MSWEAVCKRMCEKYQIEEVAPCARGIPAVLAICLARRAGCTSVAGAWMRRSDASYLKKTPPGPNKNYKAKRNPATQWATGYLELKPGSVLLSHGETPHYHRRWAVSLPSSGWDRVVPTRYCRQANWLFQLLANECKQLVKIWKSLLSVDKFVVFISAMTTLKLLGCYMVKPHGQLVLVSFMHYCTSTPSLSTL